MTCPFCLAPVATEWAEYEDCAECTRMEEPCVKHAAMCWRSLDGECSTPMERARWALFRLKSSNSLAHSVQCWMRGVQPCLCGLDDLIAALELA